MIFHADTLFQGLIYFCLPLESAAVMHRWVSGRKRCVGCSVLDPLSLKHPGEEEQKRGFLIKYSGFHVINLCYTRIKKKYNQITNDLADYCTMGRNMSTPTLGQPFSFTGTRASVQILRSHLILWLCSGPKLKGVVER